MGTKVMEALEDNFVEYEEFVATLIEGHIKAVDEDKEEVDEDSMDVDEKKFEDKKKSADKLKYEVENFQTLNMLGRFLKVQR